MPISAFSTDLYQLTMLAGYFERKMLPVRATFELFVRRLPTNRSFLVAAGLEQVLEYLEGLTFADEEITWLREQGSVPPCACCVLRLSSIVSILRRRLGDA